MAKKSLSILLLAALICQCFSKLGIIAYYQINRDFIASHLCINRDKPQMHCNGKCYLNRKLRSDEKPDQNKGNNDNKIELSIFCATDVFNLNTPMNGTEVSYPELITVYLQSRTRFLFHPPQKLS